jgi:hypothetical protein
MAGKLAGLRRRLELAEKTAAETAEQENLADCICKVKNESETATILFSWDPEKLEAEMNQKCAVHGFRQLGKILTFYAVKRGGVRCGSSRFDELLIQYHTREAEYEKARREQDQQEV